VSTTAIFLFVDAFEQHAQRRLFGLLGWLIRLVGFQRRRFLGRFFQQHAQRWIERRWRLLRHAFFIFFSR